VLSVAALALLGGLASCDSSTLTVVGCRDNLDCRAPRICNGRTRTCRDPGPSLDAGVAADAESTPDATALTDAAPAPDAPDSPPDAGGAKDAAARDASGSSPDAANSACPTAGGDLSPGLTEIATSTRPLNLALDHCNVYWVDMAFGGLMRVPKVGGQSSLVATGTPPPPGTGMGGTALVSDGQTIYWSEYVAWASAGADASALGSGEVIATSSAGISRRIWSGPAGATALAVDESYLYILSDRLQRVPLRGGPVETLARRGGVYGLTLAGPNVYWTIYALGDVVLSVPKAGGATSTASVGRPTMPCGSLAFAGTAIAHDQQNLYWGDLGEDACWGTIYEQPIIGGPPTVLVSDMIEPSGLVVDGNQLYATTGESGSVLQIDLPTGNVTTLASGQSWPTGIAADETFIYWANNFGAQTGIMRGGK
jgi:hypothetical protein